MSLDRFLNKEELIANESYLPNKWTQNLIASGQIGALAIPSTVFNPSNLLSRDNIEAHLYTMDGTYQLKQSVDPANLSFGIDVQDFANKINIKSGNYFIVFNFHKYGFNTGSPKDPALKVIEISPDRREIYLRGDPSSPNYAN